MEADMAKGKEPRTWTWACTRAWTRTPGMDMNIGLIQIWSRSTFIRDRYCSGLSGPKISIGPVSRTDAKVLTIERFEISAPVQRICNGRYIYSPKLILMVLTRSNRFFYLKCEGPLNLQKNIQPPNTKAILIHRLVLLWIHLCLRWTFPVSDGDLYKYKEYLLYLLVVL